jgi:hypothetical protein
LSEIRLDTTNVAAEVEKIAQSVESVVGGFEKARAVIGGLYDDLILWERASEYWENKSFQVRANEIKHLAKLGQISAEEEARLWQMLMDEKVYGWKNVKIAEENYHKALYEQSRHWIEEQTRLGKLSAEEVAQAWQRVFEKFDDVNIKYQAALKIRDALLFGADEEISKRRYFSDRWMTRQDIYDGGDPKRQVEDYTRRIQAEVQLLREIESGFLNGVQLGPIEQTQRWREVYEYIQDLEDKRYKVARDYIRSQADEYAAEMKKALQDTYNYRMDMYSRELAAISEKYDGYAYRRRESERSQRLGELNTLKGYYKDSVTKEGQDKYKSILEQIRAIEAEADEDYLRQRQKEEEERVRSKITAAKKEYENSLALLEKDRQALLQAAANTALQGISTAQAAGGAISDIMLGVNRSFSQQVEGLFEKSEQYLMQKVASIANLFSAIGNYYNQAVSGNSGTNINVTLNDYGDKNMISKNAVVSYASEFVSIVYNTLRAKGVR